MVVQSMPVRLDEAWLHLLEQTYGMVSDLPLSFLWFEAEERSGVTLLCEAIG